MNEHCGNCAKCYRLQKFDYSQSGCVHSDMEGYVCMAFADEGVVCWVIGNDLDSGWCENWTAKEV